ncbi:hypothetical protein F5887DRAFT_982117, partial [Amanita rubescens]
IKTELGMESDGKDKLIKKFTERAAALNNPSRSQITRRRNRQTSQPRTRRE